MQKLNVEWNASSCWAVVLPLVVAAGRGHGLVERRVVAHDVVLEALRERLEPAELASLSWARRTRTCSGCRSVRRRTRSGSRASCPGVRGNSARPDRRRPNGRRVYRRGVRRPQPLVPPTRADGPARSDSAGACADAVAERGARDVLLDSATDHATPRLPGAVLRTPLRGAVGPPVPHEAPADPAPAPRRAGHGVWSDVATATGPSCRTASPSTSRRRDLAALARRPSRRSPADLADAALEFARSHHYRLADRPTVALVADVVDRAGRRPRRDGRRAGAPR